MSSLGDLNRLTKEYNKACIEHEKTRAARERKRIELIYCCEDMKRLKTARDTLTLLVGGIPREGA